jgi:hypothetical protein
MTVLASRLARLEACVRPNSAMHERLADLIGALPIDLLRRLADSARIGATDGYPDDALTRELIDADRRWSPILAGWKSETTRAAPHGR